MSILEVVYASSPTGAIIVPTLEIKTPTQGSIFLCNGFENLLLGVDGVMREFEAGNLEISLPAKDSSGNQSLSFGVYAGNGRAQRYVDEALESGQHVTLIFREYLLSDPSQPAKRPVSMIVRGGQFEGDAVVFDAGYYDILNTRWPRDSYTAETAPGLKYFK